MTISEFKKPLAKTGVHYSQVRLAFVRQGLNLAWTIRDCANYERVISNFLWSNSKEGYDFWRNVHSGEKPKKIIAYRDEIVSYLIQKDGNNWVVGCQTVNRKQRLKLFKLLAEDLGYEVEG